MATPANAPISVREYLSMLTGGDVRYEYFRGEVSAMAGGSIAHVALNFNLAGMLWGQLQGSRCTAGNSDLLVLEESGQHYMFPDCVVYCEGARWTPSPVPALLDPSVVFEILSPSTETIDRTTKFASYTKIESLQHLILVHQDKRLVEHYYRESANVPWMFEHVFQADGVIELDSVGVRLTMADLYRGVEAKWTELKADGENPTSGDR